MFVSRTRGDNVTLDVFVGFGSDARGYRPRRCRNIHFGALRWLEVDIARPLRLKFLGGNETIRVANGHCGGGVQCQYKVYSPTVWLYAWERDRSHERSRVTW